MRKSKKVMVKLNFNSGHAIHSEERKREESSRRHHKNCPTCIVTSKIYAGIDCEGDMKHPSRPLSFFLSRLMETINRYHTHPGG